MSSEFKPLTSISGRVSTVQLLRGGVTKKPFTSESLNHLHQPSTYTMCGIHAAISPSHDYKISDDLKQRLCNRGPDHTGSVQTQVALDDATDRSLFLTFTSTVLSLRGDHVAKQPLVDEESGAILCWNGEAWRIDGEPVKGNDGEAVLTLLEKARREASDGDTVLDALRTIEGPFAFIYFDKPGKRVYYGRDRLGRRSLLVNPGMPFSLCSITETPVQGWVEVEADGCYTIQLDQVDAAGALVPTRHDWACDPALVSSIFRSPPLLNQDPATYSFRFRVLGCSIHKSHSSRISCLKGLDPSRICINTWWSR